MELLTDSIAAIDRISSVHLYLQIIIISCVPDTIKQKIVNVKLAESSFVVYLIALTQ